MTDEPVAPTEQQEIRPPRETPNYGLPVPGDAGPADYVDDTGRLADAHRRATARCSSPATTASAARAASGPAGCCATAAPSTATCTPTCSTRSARTTAPATARLTFNLPDFRGRMPYAVNATTGEAPRRRRRRRSHALTIAELAHHAHGVADGGHAHAGGWFTWGSELTVDGLVWGFGFAGMGAAAAGIGIHGEGGNAPHNNMPPYLGVNVFIKT